MCFKKRTGNKYLLIIAYYWFTFLVRDESTDAFTTIFKTCYVLTLSVKFLMFGV